MKTLFKKPLVRDYLLIIVGSLIVASGYVFFVTPYKIIPGGVYGIAIILHYLSVGLIPGLPEGLPIGMTALCFNVPLVIMAYKLLGSSTGPKTIVTFVSTSVFVDLLTMIQGTNQLVPDDPLLSSIYGGVLIGVGVAMIFKTRATSAGTDVLSRIIHKYTNIPVGVCIMMVDSIIVLMGFIAFREWSVPLYSWITIFVYGKVVDVLQQGLKSSRAVIINTQHSEAMGEMILHKLKRGGTYLHGKGMYAGEEREIIYTVVDSRQVARLRQMIREVDPKAFITVLPAHEILGEGFKSLNEECD